MASMSKPVQSVKIVRGEVDAVGILERGGTLVIHVPERHVTAGGAAALADVLEAWAVERATISVHSISSQSTRAARRTVAAD